MTKAIAPVIVMPGKRLQENVEPELYIVDFKFGHMEPHAVVDQMGPIDRLIKDCTKWHEAAKESLKARMMEPGLGGKVTLPGVQFYAELSRIGRRSIDMEKLVAKFGEAALADCYVDSNYLRLSVKPRKDVDNDDEEPPK
jgi:hypothetical protein